MFLRAIVATDNPDLNRFESQAKQIFVELDEGSNEAVVSDAVLAEVAFILTARSHYGLSVDEAAPKLKVLLSLPGLKVNHRRIVLHALDLWTERPKLGFVDALVASQAQHLDVQLVTFDSDFDGIEGIERWNPEANGNE